MIQCPNCGTSMPDDKRFCTNCGRSLSGAAPQDTAEQTSGHAEGAVPDETAEQQESARTEGAASSEATYAAPPYTQPVQQRPVFIQKDDARLAPVGIWMWLGVFLIACIPLQCDHDDHLGLLRAAAIAQELRPRHGDLLSCCSRAAGIGRHCVCLYRNTLERYAVRAFPVLLITKERNGGTHHGLLQAMRRAD